MDEFLSAFGANICSLRQQLGLTQGEVAHRAGIHVTYLSGIERGMRNPGLRNIHRIAVALGISVVQLFEFEG